MPYRKKNYEDRYADNWQEISYKTKQLTNGKCVLCPKPAAHTHHVLYRDKRGAIAGREVPGVHIFPLCMVCHKTAHKRTNWRKDPIYPELGNRNTSRFYKELRAAWVELVNSNEIEKPVRPVKAVQQLQQEKPKSRIGKQSAISALS